MLATEYIEDRGVDHFINDMLSQYPYGRSQIPVRDSFPRHLIHNFNHHVPICQCHIDLRANRYMTIAFRLISIHIGFPFIYHLVGLVV